MSGPHPTTVGPVMMFTTRRSEVARFYREIAGLTGDDAAGQTWLDAENAKVALSEPTDRDSPPEVRSQPGFVVWFGVADIRSAFDRATREGSVVGEFHGDYFFARDPDGRYVGIFTLEDHHGHEHEH